MNRIDITRFVVHDPKEGDIVPNSFETYSGAKAGIGRFLVNSEKAIVTNGEDSVKITLTSETTEEGKKDTKKVEINAYPIAFNPLSIHKKNDGNDINTTLFEGIFYDKRHVLSSVSGQYNLTDESGNYFSETTNSGTPYTWAEIVDDIASQLSIVINIVNDAPTYTPQNIIFDNVCGADAINAIANLMFMVVGYNYTTEAFNLYGAGVASVANQVLIDAYKNKAINNVIQNGNIKFLRNFKALPKTITVAFPVYNPDDATDRWYTKDIVVNAVGLNISKVLQMSNFWAIRTPDGIDNSSTLDDIATEAAADYFDLISQDVDKFTFAGVLPFELDGYIRAIKWDVSPKGATTTIQINNSNNFSPLGQIRSAVADIASVNCVMQNGIAGSTPSGKFLLNPFSDIEFGKTTGSFTSGDTITLDPCDQDGNDNGKDNVVVYLAPDRTSVSASIANAAICSFRRFKTSVDATTDVNGVLVGFKSTTPSAASIAHILSNSDVHTDVNITPATGDIIYRDGSDPAKWVNLAIGDTAEVLTVSAGLPSWESLPDGASNLIYKQHRIKVLNTSTNGSHKIDTRDWRMRPVHVELLGFWGYDEFGGGGYEMTPEDSQYAWQASSPYVKHGTFWVGDDLGLPANTKLNMIFISGVTWVVSIEIDATTGELYWSWASMSYASAPVHCIVRVHAFEKTDSIDYTTS